MLPTAAEMLADMADWEKCEHRNREEVQGHGVFDDVKTEVSWCWECGAIYTYHRNACDRHYGTSWTPPWTEGMPTARQTALMLYRRTHGLKRFLLFSYWKIKLQPILRGRFDATNPSRPDARFR